jgi:hypothetical protein
MGVFTVAAEIADLARTRALVVDLQVGSNSSYAALPASMLHELGVEPNDENVFTSDRYGARRLEIGQAWMRIGHRETAAVVVFAEEDWKPSMCHVTLSQFSLGVSLDGESLMEVLPRMCDHWTPIHD